MTKKVKGKNIIVCADGTGNRGGVGRGTNVWRIFNALDTSQKERKQVITYHDGVGTQKWLPFRLLAGAVGVGLSSNVRDLYKFLALNYEQGDHIYLFGFSRGAFTVRVLENMIAMYGLPKTALNLGEDNNTDIPFGCLSIKQIDRHVSTILKYYKNEIGDGSPFKNGNGIYAESVQHQEVKTCVLGVWDTVNSVGMPAVLRSLFWMITPWSRDQTIDHAPMNATYAFQALAIDEERSPFNPRFWTGGPTHASTNDSIIQVWFAGMHSNVGGGYPKDGLAHTALKWMVDELCRIPDRVNPDPDGTNISSEEIIKFEPNALKQVNNAANAHDRMYDSRRAFGRYYRYKPRNIFDIVNRGSKEYKPFSFIKNTTEKFNLIEQDAQVLDSAQQLKLPIIHESALERIQNHTDSYYPTAVPHRYNVWRTFQVGKKIKAVVEPRHVIPAQGNGAQYITNTLENIETHRDARGMAWTLLTLGTLSSISLFFYSKFSDEKIRNVFAVFETKQIEQFEQWGAKLSALPLMPDFSKPLLVWLSANPILSGILLAYFGMLFFASNWNKKEMSEVGKKLWSREYNTGNAQEDEIDIVFTPEMKQTGTPVLRKRISKSLFVGKAKLDKFFSGLDY